MHEKVAKSIKIERSEKGGNYSQKNTKISDYKIEIYASSDHLLVMKRLFLKRSRRDLFKNNLFITNRWVQAMQISILQSTKFCNFYAKFSSFLNNQILLIFVPFLQKNIKNDEFSSKFCFFVECDTLNTECIL